ncbi:hypothetical protein GCM10009117_15420 [Gangjinia marincola]|uniref:Pentapeptide repeat-containing protein n=1 Tax=Gangjinia marincola TaxID=578463 RepID=A0ABN1MHE0_9FLAO
MKLEYDPLVGSKEYKIKLSQSDLLKTRINLEIRDYKIKSPLININKIYLERLVISNLIKSRINVSNIHASLFKINNLVSPQELKLSNISAKNSSKSEISFSNSDLESALFNNINFKNFSLISFYKSTVSEAKFFSCKFPSNILNYNNFNSLEHIDFGIVDKNIFYRDQYHTFLSLKKSLEKTGDIYEAQKMKSLAYRYLEKMKGLRFFQDVIPLKLNKWSSDHGISPIKALCWIIGVSGLLYFLLLLSFDHLQFDPNNKKWYSALIINFKYFIVLLNPVHRVSDLIPKGEEDVNSIYLLSFFSRVIIGYLYYQFIAAFRRFGKI